MRRSTVVVCLATAAATAFIVPAVASADPPPTLFGTVMMAGTNEMPTGDPDGTGVFVFAAGNGKLCYHEIVRNIDPATASHIHHAAVGVAGPIVIGLKAPTTGTSSGCIAAVPDSQQTPANQTATLTVSELADIIANPANYYVNAHNPAFPAGAARGQLNT